MVRAMLDLVPSSDAPTVEVLGEVMLAREER